LRADVYLNYDCASSLKNLSNKKSV
jgi:hypothetical protein